MAASKDSFGAKSTLSVGDQEAAVAAATGDLSSLVYTDAANYSYRTIDTLAKASGTPGSTLRDVRGGVRKCDLIHAE